MKNISARMFAGGGAGRSSTSPVAVVALLIAGMSFAGADGGIAADGDRARAARDAVGAPISLAGRWKGMRYAYNFRARDAEKCAGRRCELTYDMVACGDAWCGIAVTDDTTCGAIALRLGADAKAARGQVFNGKLELAAGAAPYTVQAWYAAPDGTAADGTTGQRRNAKLRLVGDTGSELLMMRRSFPFQADLQRIADATCTLENATS